MAPSGVGPDEEEALPEADGEEPGTAGSPEPELPACGTLEEFAAPESLEAQGGGEAGASPERGGEAAAASSAAEGDPAEEGSAENVERLRREHKFLFNDLSVMKARFELTLQTLRSILRLDASATWADVIEGCERVAERALQGGGGVEGDGGAFTDGQVRDEELQQAELECEQLEEKLEAQTAHIARLRELLQKQQGLLDMTARQFESQHEQSEQQTEKIAELEERGAAQLETLATQEMQIIDLSAQRGRLQEEILEHQRVVAAQQQRLEAYALREAELEGELEQTRLALSSTSEECRRLHEEAEAAQRQAKLEADRAYEEIRTLEEALHKQGEIVERVTDQLQVHEAAERRRCSYRAEFRTSRSLVEDEVMSGGLSEQTSVGSALPSARGSRGADPLLSSPPSGSRARGSGAVGARSPLSTSSVCSAGPPLSEMPEEERVKFLAHFPMSSRTERLLRNRLDDRRKVKPGAP